MRRRPSSAASQGTPPPSTIGLRNHTAPLTCLSHRPSMSQPPFTEPLAIVATEKFMKASVRLRVFFVAFLTSVDSVDTYIKIEGPCRAHNDVEVYFHEEPSPLVSLWIQQGR